MADTDQQQPQHAETKAEETSTQSANISVLCMGCKDEKCDFKPLKLERRPVGDFDVLIDMKYCGVCHSDLHMAASHNKINKANYPCVPGHELAGVVTQVGSKVTKVKVGQKVGVGCMVDSCLNCANCKKGEEQKCASTNTGTYNNKDKHGRAHHPGGYTLGGYTDKFVVHEHFTIIIPDTYPLECAGPVMCAGITMYDPLKKYEIKEGKTVGIVGLGGLGQMGVRLGNALGAKVTVISRSNKKEAFAKECGAETFVVSTDKESMKAQKGSLDLILNTVPGYHDYCAYNSLLKKSGKQVLLGLHAGIAGAVVVNKLTFGTSRVTMSGIGGIPNTEEVLALCDKHKIYPKIKVMPCEDLNEIYTKLDGSNDEGLRYVLDIENTLNEKTSEKCEGKEPPTLAPFSGGITPAAAVKEGLYLFVTGKWL